MRTTAKLSDKIFSLENNHAGMIDNYGDELLNSGVPTARCTSLRSMMASTKFIFGERVSSDMPLEKASSIVLSILSVMCRVEISSELRFWSESATSSVKGVFMEAVAHVLLRLGGAFAVSY
eukprot:m.168045 g.168045  ORF g.168045 m.168045 type:complete len:121 (-) comp14741_c0_seq7:2029-2391(-)